MLGISDACQPAGFFQRVFFKSVGGGGGRLLLGDGGPVEGQRRMHLEVVDLHEDRGIVDWLLATGATLGRVTRDGG